MKFLRLMFLLVASLPLAACALSGEAIEGRVLEEGTNKPIAGAIVVVRWMGDTTSGSWLVESRTSCYHVETATTDGQGSYRTKPWRQPQHKDYTVKFNRIAIDAYKPGYGFPDKLSRTTEVEYLSPFKGTREARLDYLRSLSGKECGSQHDYAKKLIPLYRALYEEARAIAVTPIEKHIAGGLHYSLDRLEVGEVESLKRLGAGEYEK